uniref:transketolase n=1 Tax=Oryctolagus cuniculus TaxID=9986 RepID=G1TPB0_RABIT
MRARAALRDAPAACGPLAEARALRSHPRRAAAARWWILFFHTMRYKPAEPAHLDNDRFVLSKGHAAPLLYAAWAEAGAVGEAELLRLRQAHCALEGHPTPRLPFVDVATGSLGQGLGAACGMAYAGKYLDRASYRVFCLLGDGETAEGSVWEALAFASHYRLDNLVAVLDVNRWGQSGATALGHRTDAYARRLEAFGWNTCLVDGHDVEALCRAFRRASQVQDKPTAVVAKTFKGRGVPSVEDAGSWHGKALPREAAEAAIARLESQMQTQGPCSPRPPVEDSPPVSIADIRMPSPPAYRVGDQMSTRKACGLALAKLGRANDRVVVLDGDTQNSTFSDLFKQEHPERFVECFVAEQNMIRMAAISQANINLVGSHCGVSVGEDGPSQMALEDLAMFRSVPGCTVFYPSDAVSTEHAVHLAAKAKGMCFIRTSRPDTAVIYAAQERFEIGQAKVVRHSADDKVTVVGAGVTLHEALAAAEELSQEGVSVRVIDLFTVKPLDAATIISSAGATGGRVVTVEDHYREGGLGEAVCAAVAREPAVRVHLLAVSGVPRSGRPRELLDAFGISAGHIVAAVKSALMQENN